MIEKGVPIFPRLEVETEITYIQEQMRGPVKAEETKEEKEEVADVPEITIDEFYECRFTCGHSHSL